MTIRGLTPQQHADVLSKLYKLTHRVEPGFEMEHTPYSLLMLSLLHHQANSARSLSMLLEMGAEWFPVVPGYAIVRTMFEVDVTAHYISMDSEDRVARYIAWKHVSRYRLMTNCKEHMKSKNTSWRDGLKQEWEAIWADQEQTIIQEYKSANRIFELKKSSNWSGFSLRTMAEKVNHLEAYDMFYRDLSSIVHGSISLADRYISTDSQGFKCTVRADETDVGFVFRYAAIFLSCFLDHVSSIFSLWTTDEVESCWDL